MKKFKVDGWNNFCRVFQLPNEYPRGYCFNGGLPTTFVMVDWFNPFELPQPAVTKEVWALKVGPIESIETTIEELKDKLENFILGKQYICPNSKYLVITDFGATFIIQKENT